MATNVHIQDAPAAKSVGVWMRFVAGSKQLLQKRRSRLVLSKRGSQSLIDALENPPVPNEHLQKAFACYEREVTREP